MSLNRARHYARMAVRELLGRRSHYSRQTVGVRPPRGSSLQLRQMRNLVSQADGMGLSDTTELKVEMESDSHLRPVGARFVVHLDSARQTVS